MEVRAHLRFLRIAPRKVRLVINLIRGLAVDQAVDQLLVLPKRAATPILKLLNSAIANAEHNFQLERKNLYIQSIVANEGPRLKRFQPRAFGRAAEILKRMSHVTIVLADRTASPAGPKTKSAVSKSPVIAGAPKHAALTTKTPAALRPIKLGKSPTAKPKARDAQDPAVRRQGKS